MLSQPKSAKLSLYLTDIIFAALTLIAIFLPKLAMWYICIANRPLKLFKLILITCYICLPFAIWALVSLRKLLKNILKGEIFIQNNINQLNFLFICCLLVCIITIISGFFYMPFLIVGIAAGFFSLILRVIKNVFHSAIEIKSENELTI